MKVEKFKVLLYLKKSGTDKSGKAPIITVNRWRCSDARCPFQSKKMCIFADTIILNM